MALCTSLLRLRSFAARRKLEVLTNRVSIICFDNSLVGIRRHLETVLSKADLNSASINDEYHSFLLLDSSSSEFRTETESRIIAIVLITSGSEKI